MSHEWLNILTQFSKLNNFEKVAWLAHLLHNISIIARSTYRAGSNTVDDPEALRRFNELNIRILEQQIMILSKAHEVRPDNVLFEIISHEAELLNITQYLIDKTGRFEQI